MTTTGRPAAADRVPDETEHAGHARSAGLALDSVPAIVRRLTAELTLAKGSIHVVSDVHGEDVKLRHVINNASGTLRPLAAWRICLALPSVVVGLLVYLLLGAP